MLTPARLKSDALAATIKRIGYRNAAPLASLVGWDGVGQITTADGSRRAARLADLDLATEVSPVDERGNVKISFGPYYAIAIRKPYWL